MNLRCIAIDDEPFALQILEDNIGQIPFLELVGTYTNPLDTWPLIKQEQTDLIFLDVQMPTLTGIQFLRSLPKRPMIIFSTAYEQYAREGFDLDVVDYLVKPTTFDRFLRAATKARDLFTLRQRVETGAPATERTFFFIHSEYREIKIFHDEILYIEGLKDYVKLYTLQQPNKPLLIRLNLKAIEARLIPTEFCRVHQSFIVALSRITSFQKNNLYIGNREIPIGNRFAEAFRTKYRQVRPMA